MQEAARTRYVAEHYPNLQGLASLPLGLFCLELFLLGIGWLTLPGVFLFWSIGMTILLTIVATIFYRFTYGYTRPLRRVQRRDAIFAIGMGIILAITLILDLLLQPRVNLSEEVLAGGLFLYYWPHRRFAIHYFIIAIVIACIGLLPLFGGGADHSIFTCVTNGCTITINFSSHSHLLSQTGPAQLLRFFLSFAILGIVGGFCDHLLLKHTFVPLQREDQ